MTFRIGIIDYLNTQPFQYTLERQLGQRGVDFVRGVPTALNRALLAGEIDLAPISAVFAAEHADDFVVLPGHGISSHGAVKTVLLFSWRPDIHELDGETIALTDHSATSVALLKVLCRERYGISPRFVTTRQDLASMMQRAAAALVIGDTALVEGFLHRELPRGDYSYGRPTIFDLGDEWLKLAGLPFTFAVWAARRESAGDLLALDVPAALAASKAAGLAHLGEIAAAYAPALSLPAGVCTRYLRDLRFDLTASDRAGLAHFLDLALPGFQPHRLAYLEDAVETLPA
jgi:chorismate dehydratase